MSRLARRRSSHISTHGQAGTNSRLQGKRRMTKVGRDRHYECASITKRGWPVGDLVSQRVNQSRRSDLRRLSFFLTTWTEHPKVQSDLIEDDAT